MRIRPYRPDDLPEVVDLWRACELTRPYNDPEADIAFCRASTDSELLIGERDGTVVASVMVGHDGHRGYVYYLAVAPSEQRGGLGGQVMMAAEQWLIARGVPKLNIIIRESNTRVQGFYERLGFEVTPRLMMGKFLCARPGGGGDRDGQN